jgi:hypothetical protein
MVYALYIQYPATGYTKVETFATAFDRGLYMIAWRDQPVILRPVDYAPKAA